MGLLAALIVIAGAIVVAGADSQPSASTGQAPGWLGADLRNGPTGEVVVSRVVPGSPADEVGLKPGDVIVRIDHTLVALASDVTTALSRVSPGQVVSVSVRRGPASFTMHAALIARPEGAAVP
jgi:S1-C subfamily serine protease